MGQTGRRDTIPLDKRGWLARYGRNTLCQFSTALLARTAASHAASKGAATGRQSAGTLSSSSLVVGPRMARRCHAQPSRCRVLGPRAWQAWSCSASSPGAKSTSCGSAAPSKVTKRTSSCCIASGATWLSSSSNASSASSSPCRTQLVMTPSAVHTTTPSRQPPPVPPHGLWRGPHRPPVHAEDFGLGCARPRAVQLSQRQSSCRPRHRATPPLLRPLSCPLDLRRNLAHTYLDSQQHPQASLD